VTPQVFGLTLFLTLAWGVYLVAAIREYRAVRFGPSRIVLTRQQELVRAFRRVIVDLCVFMLPAAFVLRTGLVLLGFGNDVIGAVLFFALVGPNVVGSIFAVASLRYD
jgi:hypothetical protein